MTIKCLDSVCQLVGINIQQGQGIVELSQECLAKQIVKDYTRLTYTQRSILPESTLDINPGEPVGQTKYQINNWIPHVFGQWNKTRHCLCCEPSSQILYQSFQQPLDGPVFPYWIP